MSKSVILMLVEKINLKWWRDLKNWEYACSKFELQKNSCIELKYQKIIFRFQKTQTKLNQNDIWDL